MKLTVIGITFTFNEEKLVPYVMQYWQRINPDKLVVYDNESTDRTVELLKQYPFVEVRTYKTEGKFDEFALTRLRNNVWKKENADWIILTDFDEVPYCKTDLRDFLSRTDATLIRTFQYNVITQDFPEFKEGTLLHDAEGALFHEAGERYRKTHILKPEKIINSNLEVGCHSMHPVGAIRFMQFPDEVCFYHLKYLGEKYAVEKAMHNYERLPEAHKIGKYVNWHLKVIAEQYQETINKMLSENEKKRH